MSTQEAPVARRLLVVDDEQSNRDMLSRRLERRGYRVVLAGSGPEALQTVEAGEVDLILLDWMMPGMSGLDLLRLLRATRSSSDLPIIMVTARGESDNVVEALESGANDYVTKPLDFAVVMARIGAQLSRRTSEEAVRRSEERYALAARSANEALWDWHLPHGPVYFSPRWETLLGCPLSRPMDDGGEPMEPWLARVHPEDAPRVRAELESLRRGGVSSLATEHRLLRGDGSTAWVSGSAIATRSGDAVVRLTGTLADVTASKMTDTVTGLPTRLRLREEIASTLRAERPLSVAILSLDSVHGLLHSLGRVAADSLILEMARRCREALQAHARHCLAHLGAGEFGVLLADADAASCARVLTALQSASARPLMVEGMEVRPSASLGVAFHTCGGSGAPAPTPDGLLDDAEMALCHARLGGKSRFAVFEPYMRRRALDRLRMECEIRRGLDENQFVPHYQCKVCLRTGRITEFEALVRWNHPTRGLVPPSEFIPLAEETGLIVPLGEWMLRQSCAQAAEWHRRFPMDPPLAVSVNLSCRQFAQPGLVGMISTILKETGLPASSLRLEVTESVLVGDAEAAGHTLHQLRRLDIGLKIDDFGTGYSSLSYLHKLPFDTLKIDRSFVSNLDRSTESLEVVRAIIGLATRLGMGVVAEGVETGEQAALLASLGCDHGQGYFFSKPISATAAGELLSAHFATKSGSEWTSAPPR